jgi:phosphonate transport system substrate-binding protein
MTFFFAKSKYQAKAILQIGHYGEKGYESTIIASKKSGIKSLEDLKNRKFSFACSDRASVSSCILPNMEFDKLKIKPYKELIAGSMDAAITAVMQGKVDVAGIFHNMPVIDKKTGKILEVRDARRNIVSTFPKIYDETNVVWVSQEIPNEPVMVRADLPKSVEDILKNSMPKCFRAHPGINDIDDLFPLESNSHIYDEYMQKIKTRGIDFGAVVHERSKKSL